MAAALLLLALVAGPAAAGQATEPDRVAQLRAALYHALMAEILRTGVESATDGARWSLGEVNPYPSLTADKVIVACINWDNTTIGAVDWYGYSYYYDRSRPVASGDPEQLEALEEQALGFCRRYEALSECHCQPVDRNGGNALQLPEWFGGSRPVQGARQP